MVSWSSALERGEIVNPIDGAGLFLSSDVPHCLSFAYLASPPRSPTCWRNCITALLCFFVPFFFFLEPSVPNSKKGSIADILRSNCDCRLVPWLLGAAVLRVADCRPG